MQKNKTWNDLGILWFMDFIRSQFSAKPYFFAGLNNGSSWILFSAINRCFTTPRRYINECFANCKKRPTTELVIVKNDLTVTLQFYCFCSFVFFCMGGVRCFFKQIRKGFFCVLFFLFPPLSLLFCLRVAISDKLCLLRWPMALLIIYSKKVNLYQRV